MYFITLASLLLGGDILYTAQKGMGKKIPINMANGIIQYPAGRPILNNSFPRAPIAIEALLYC